MDDKHDKYLLRLYIAGITAENQKTIVDFEHLLQLKIEDNYSLEVIDIFANPELADGDKIVATPTLVKALPLPLMKVILDFNSKEKLLLGMDLILEEDEPNKD